MSLIKNISQYLEDNGIGTEATDIFSYLMPAEVNNCIMLDEAGGLEPDKYLPTKDPTIDIKVRNSNPDNGKAKIEAIKDLLHQKQEFIPEAGGVEVMICQCIVEPFHLGTDENERHLFTSTFYFKTR